MITSNRIQNNSHCRQIALIAADNGREKNRHLGIRLPKIVGIIAIASAASKTSNAHDERFRVDGPGQHDAAVVQSHVSGAIRASNAQAQASVQDAPSGARPEE